MPDRKKNTLGIMQDSIFFFRSFAARKSVRNNAGFLGTLPPPRKKYPFYVKKIHLTSRRKTMTRRTTLTRSVRWTLRRSSAVGGASRCSCGGQRLRRRRRTRWRRCWRRWRSCTASGRSGSSWFGKEKIKRLFFNFRIIIVWELTWFVYCAFLLLKKYKACLEKGKKKG